MKNLINHFIYTLLHDDCLAIIYNFIFLHCELQEVEFIQEL
jgi:hypothetical protein